MKLPTWTLLLPAATAEIHSKQMSTPFPDDPSVVVLSPHRSSSRRRRLQSGATSCASDQQALWSLSLVTDSNPSDTEWTLKRASTNELELLGPPADQEYEANTLYEGTACILKGIRYVFRITDSGGDGMCCDAGDGGFTMSVDGDVFVDGTGREDDWSRKNYLFHVGNLTEIFTSRPTPRPTVWEMPTAPDFTTASPTLDFNETATAQPTELNVTTDKPTLQPTEGANDTLKPTAAVAQTYSPTFEPVEEVAVSFILMADIPYYTNHKYCLNQQLRELNPATMTYPYSFIVHLGDLKSGQTKDCVNEYYTDLADIFSSSLNDYYYDTRDCFFLIGDNDWCDCNDPGSAFSYWMNSFGNGNKYNWINRGPNSNGFGTFSNSNLRQTLEYDDDGSTSDSSYYPSGATNFAFFINKVLFVGINQVGGAEIGDESTRVRNNFEWVKGKMETYAQQDMRSLVVFAHASMSGARWQYFGQPFQSLLQDYYPDILALYAHGDGHEFNLDRIDKYNPNLYQLQSDSGDLGDPLLVTITRAGSERDGLNVDRRGGTYEDGDCAPDNRDKTWNSDMF